MTQYTLVGLLISGLMHVCTGHRTESDLRVIESSGSACSDVATITAALNNAKKGGWQFKRTHMPGPKAGAADALQDALETFAKESEGSICDVRKMKWGTEKYHDSVSGFTKVRALVAEIGLCCASKEDEQTEENVQEKTELTAQAEEVKETRETSTKAQKLDVMPNSKKIQTANMDKPHVDACGDVETVTEALEKAVKDGVQLKRTDVKGPKADAANALQDALEAFAKKSEDSTCDVRKMKWGKKERYYKIETGFKKAQALVAEIELCCSEQSEDSE